MPTRTVAAHRTPWDDPSIAAATSAPPPAAAPAPAGNASLPPQPPATVDSVMGYARVPQMPKSVAQLRAKFQMEEAQDMLKKQLVRAQEVLVTPSSEGTDVSNHPHALLSTRIRIRHLRRTGISLVQRSQRCAQAVTNLQYSGVESRTQHGPSNECDWVCRHKMRPRRTLWTHLCRRRSCRR